MRESRKLDHLKHSLALADGPGDSGFSDVALVHNCLPELNWDELDITAELAGITLSKPLIINAITGGAHDVAALNGRIAEFAYRTNTAMAAGSQFAGVENPDVQHSYKIIREKNPDGVIFANLGAYASPEQARLAVAMLDAQALQIHLNPAQEMVMTEGDRNFAGYLRNIASIAESVSVPVIVKEVGCGISREQASLLAKTGIKAIDVGGRGGTNFLAIEAARRNIALPEEMLSWGIPTVISALETASVLPPAMDLMVSGGVRTALDVAKALALGGSAAGIAAPVIKVLCSNDMDYAIEWFNQLLHELKFYMLLTGAGTIAGLQEVPLVITGNTREWLETRGIKAARR